MRIPIDSRSGKIRPAGFTLIELLVVVAIIAVLISILLPSLSGARRAAKKAVCGANQRQIGIAGAGYFTENADWIPGSPNTTGIPALGPGGLSPQYHDPPTTPWDWVTPLRYYYMNERSMPLYDAIQRMYESREGAFRCPEQGDIQEPARGAIPTGLIGSRYAIQTAASYLMMWKMLTVGRSYESSSGSSTGRVQGVFVNSASSTQYSVNWLVAPLSWESLPPRNYVPQFTRIGPPERKIFLMDGARFVDGTDGALKFTYWTRSNSVDESSWGAGNYASSGPVYVGSREYGTQAPYEPRDYGRRKSYRHPGGRTFGLMALFFDGHAESMTEKQSRYHGYTTPSGSTLRALGQMEPDSREPLEGYNVDQVLPD